MSSNNRIYNPLVTGEELKIGRAASKQKLDDKQVRIREAVEGDISFIFSSWLKSFRAGALCKWVDNSIYFAEHHKVVEKLLKRSKVMVAAHPQNPEDIYGYICYETIDGIFVLHYAYVKQTFRNLGMLNALLSSTGNEFKTAGLYTHDVNHANRIAPLYKLFYHPYILMNYGHVADTGGKVADKKSDNDDKQG